MAGVRIPRHADHLLIRCYAGHGISSRRRIGFSSTAAGEHHAGARKRSSPGYPVKAAPRRLLAELAPKQPSSRPGSAAATGATHTCGSAWTPEASIQGVRCVSWQAGGPCTHTAYFRSELRFHGSACVCCCCRRGDCRCARCALPRVHITARGKVLCNTHSCQWDRTWTRARSDAPQAARVQRHGAWPPASGAHLEPHCRRL